MIDKAATKRSIMRQKRWRDEHTSTKKKLNTESITKIEKNETEKIFGRDKE